MKLGNPRLTVGPAVVLLVVGVSISIAQCAAAADTGPSHLVALLANDQRARQRGIVL